MGLGSISARMRPAWICPVQPNLIGRETSPAEVIFCFLCLTVRFCELLTCEEGMHR